MTTIKPESLRRSFCFLLIAAFAACLPASSQTIQNPSFETNSFSGGVGYISQNTPITGWTGTPADRVGLSLANGTSPFANNGATPNGANVAFIQSAAGTPTVLSTVIAGLTAGQKYTVNFRFNGRAVTPTLQIPVLKIGVDGTFITSLSTSNLQAAATKTAAYRYAAFNFTAAGETATMSLTNDVASDTTMLVDDFTINVSTSGWTYAAWDDDASAGVDNTKNFTHAYNFGGGAAPSATINGVTFQGIVGTAPTAANAFRASLGSQFTSDDANTITTGGSAVLSKRFVYGGNPGLFTITGLVPGREYVATFYVLGWEATFRSHTFSYGNDRMTFNQDFLGDNKGMRIMYRYIAPASGAITLIQTPTLAGNTMHTYAFANYEATADALPVVGVQPRSQALIPGANASFRITAGGQRPLFYQWYKNDAPLVDQTNRWLSVSNLTVADGGPYYVVVSNASGMVTSALANVTFDATIANPSFEATPFENYTGYISANQPISGWGYSDAARVGINPLADGPAGVGPFANNGTVPDGVQAGFIQSVSGSPQWLSTTLQNLTPGQKYTLMFRANGRSDQRPLVRVAIDGSQIGEFRCGPMAGTNAYRYVAMDFTPANATAMLHLTNDAAADTTVLVDDFKVAVSTSGWSYAAWNNDASSGVDSTRGYSHAVNLGGAGFAVDTTINGVRFRGAPGTNPKDNYSFLLTNFTGAFGAHANAVTTNGGGSALLAQSFVHVAGTAAAEIAQTIVLSNLLPGVEYEATIFAVGFDVKAYARSATFEVGTDRQTISEDAYDNFNGIRVKYRYVADASGTITIRYWPTERSASFHTYGFANQEVTSTLPPNIYRQPVSRTVAGGATIVLDALVGGQAPLFYQWQKDGVDLPGENSQVLTLPGVDGSATGGYTLIAINAQGVATSQVAVVEVGLAMANPSFEADNFTVFPGYIAANTPITGWTASLPAQMGINPASGSPFANSGTIPDGAKVAFIQADGGVLSQVITGMVVGKTYYLKYFENCRAGYAAATMAVTLGGQTIVPAHTVIAGEYQRLVSGPFLATTDSAELAFIKTPGPAGGDSTAVIDSVAVLELPPTPPTFMMQPTANTYIKEGDEMKLVALVQGTMPMSFQWQVNGADLLDATNNTLTLPGILMAQSGTYTLIASNAINVTTSQVAVVTVGLGFTELFNSGVTDTKALADGGTADLHYQLVSSADSNYPGPAVFILNDVWPATNGTYMTNGPISKWLSPRVIDPVARLGNLDGLYVFRTSFLLDTTDPATALLRGKWAMDNTGWDIRLNGISLGLTNNTGFAVFGEYAISNGFVAGSNTLEFVISNAPPPGPIAVRLELDGVAMPLVGVAPNLTAAPADATAIEQQNVTMTALAIGSAPLAYQWYKDGFLLGGQTNRQLKLTSVAGDQEGNYFLVVTNASGAVTSTLAYLTVLVPPVIDVEPASALVQRGQNATFEVAAYSTIDMTYQWYWGTNLLADATNASLVITNVMPNLRGDYQVVVANVAGSITSAVAVLTVPNTAPVAPVLGLSLSQGSTGVLQVAKLLSAATDAENDPVSLASVSATSTNGGSVVISETNVVYIPLPGFTGEDRFSYTVTDGYDTTTSVVVAFVVSGALPPTNMISIVPVAGGFQLRFAGIPGRTYEIQRATAVNGPWQAVDTQVAPPYGIIDYADATPPPGQAFYRMVSP